MIDTAVILFSLGMVAFIVVRATILDRKLPWFPPASEADPGTSPPAGARHVPGDPAPGPAPRRARTRPRRVSP